MILAKPITAGTKNDVALLALWHCCVDFAHNVSVTNARKKRKCQSVKSANAKLKYRDDFSSRAS